MYDKNKGPIFGAGDIEINDRCDNNKPNSSVFPSSFCLPPGFTRESTWQCIFGVGFGLTYAVSEYEVYMVTC
jgi:hypothetical protein